MRIADLLGSRTASQSFGQWRIAARELLQSGEHFVQVFKAVHAFRATAQLARCLWAAQQEHAQDRRLRSSEVEDLLQAVLILGDPAVSAAGGSSQPLVTQVAQRQP